MKEPETLVACICRHCGRRHEMPERDANAYGLDSECEPCLDRLHLQFMQQNAEKFGLSCAPGCRCGYGA